MAIASSVETPTHVGNVLDEEEEEKLGLPGGGGGRRAASWGYIRKSLKHHGVDISSDTGMPRRAPNGSACRNLQRSSTASGL